MSYIIFARRPSSTQREELTARYLTNNSFHKFKEVFFLPFGQKAITWYVEEKDYNIWSKKISADFDDTSYFSVFKKNAKKQAKAYLDLTKEFGKTKDKKAYLNFINHFKKTKGFMYLVAVLLAIDSHWLPKIMQKFTKEEQGIIGLQKDLTDEDRYRIALAKGMPAKEIIKKFGYIKIYSVSEAPPTEKEIEEDRKKISKEEAETIIKNIKQNQKKIQKLFKALKGEKKKLAEIANYLIWYRTVRITIFNKGFLNTLPFYKMISKKVKCTLTEVANMSKEEIISILEERPSFKKRNKPVAKIFKDDKMHFLSKKEIEYYKSKIKKFDMTAGLKGQIACKGRAKGIAKIIKDKDDLDKVKAGDILITAFTRPEFLPAMRRASAFITSEGGLTSHAAIVSRELNKPCIVGIQGLLEAINEGDYLEIDADKGIIRKISNKEPEKEEYITPREREADIAPCYWNTALQSSPLVKEIYGEKLSILYYFYSNRRVIGIMPKKEWDSIGEIISERLIEERGYFENIENLAEIAKQHIIKFLKSIKKDFSEISFEDLIKIADKIYSLFMEYDSASVFSWYIAGDLLKSKIGRILKLKQEKLDLISLPHKPTSTSEMEKDVLNAALSNKNPKVEAKKLSERYYWIPFGYDGPDIWDASHFEKEIIKHRKELKETQSKYNQIIKRELHIKNQVKKILSLHKFGAKEKRLIHILHSIAIWTDERKMLEYPLFYNYWKVLAELEKRSNLPILNLKYLFTHELKELKTNAKQLKKISDYRISNEFMISGINGEVKPVDKDRLIQIKEAIKVQEDSELIKGIVACRGPKLKYIGKVKVLLSPKECSKVNPGDILVSTMTTPDYVLAMNHALGFVTDEGGVTCHAAIVSREMNKPCIIGTRTATKVLKDGDLVEVDANKGIVKILKKAKIN